MSEQSEHDPGQDPEQDRVFWLSDYQPATILERAVDAARAKGPPEWWDSLSDSKRVDEIYKEMRRIDREQPGAQ